MEDRKTRTLIGAGEREDGLYFFCGFPKVCALAVGANSSLAELWHRRLGHPSDKVLKYIPPRINTSRCCSNQPTNNSKNQTPQFVKFAVSGVTELLRLFSSGSSHNNRVITKEKEEVSVSGVDDVVGILKSDYDNAYFVTGVFSSSIYTGECLFEDPTIKFRGTELYSRNLQLLVPFFEQPSIVLKNIQKGADSGRDFVLASWSLRTYLKLPWKPLISVEGRTIYDLNDEYKIVRHAESWNISALEAVGQIFTPGSRRLSD